MATAGRDGMTARGKILRTAGSQWLPRGMAPRAQEPTQGIPASEPPAPRARHACFDIGRDGAVTDLGAWHRGNA
jgi:hypothetical protein